MVNALGMFQNGYFSLFCAITQNNFSSVYWEKLWVLWRQKLLNVWDSCKSWPGRILTLKAVQLNLWQLVKVST